MKIATVFLVAVTVFTSLFLESSAAPQDVRVDLASALSKSLKNEKEALNKLFNYIKKYEPKCSTDEQKENLATLKKFVTEDYPAYADKINKKLWEDIKDPENRDKIIIEFLEAIMNVYITMLELGAKFKTQVEVAQAFYEAYLDIILPDAIHYAKKLVESKQPAENSCASQQTSNEGIVETNNSGIEALSQIVKSFLNHFLTKIIKIEYGKLEECKSIIETNKAKCSTDYQIEKLDEAGDFCQYYYEFAVNINEKLEADVENPENRVTINIELVEDVLDVTSQLQKRMPGLTEASEEVAQYFTETFVDLLLPNAIYYAKAMIKSASTENRCASHQTLYDRMAESEKIVNVLIEGFQNAMDKATEEEKSGITEVFNWVNEDFNLQVNDAHAKLKAAAQGSCADRAAMASELITIMDGVSVQLVSFVNTITERLNVFLYENIMDIMKNAACVSDQWSSGSSA